MKVYRSGVQRMARQIMGVYNGPMSILFTAAATRLGMPWDGSKGGGYRLLAEVVRRTGASVPLQRSQKARRPRVRVQGTARRYPPMPDVTSDEFLLSYEWRQLRMVVLTKRGARCECCGQSAKDGIVVQVDHIKPRRKYPELALVESNLQVLCEVCNHGKGNWDETDWRERRAVEFAPIWSRPPERLQ